MKMTDVFLVLCPLFYTKLPPLCLAYLAESLEQNGVRVRGYDLNIALYNEAGEEQRREWNVQNNPKLAQNITKTSINANNPTIEAFLSEINIYRPTLISFSLFKSNHYPTFKLIKIIKKQPFSPKIVCGGPEIGVLRAKMGELWLKNEGIDAIILGEGEGALTTLVKTIGCNNPLIVLSAEEVEDLDSIPSPSFKQLYKEAYDTQVTIPLLMSRGCIRQCHFCSERLLYNSYRVRSAEHVVTEIKGHMGNRVRAFVFHDSLINGDLAQLEQLCDLICKEQLTISWEAQCVVRRDMSAALLKKMKHAGCYNLFIGLESGSDPVLKRMHKGFTKKDAGEFFEKCQEAKLHFEISLITGFPGETEAEFQETCDFIVANKERIPKIAQVNPYVPYEGTITGENYPAVDENTGRERMERLVRLFERESIPYTKSYIGNLLSQ